MTGGAFAATILSDLILGNENPWAQLYDAKRLKVRGAASMLVKENAPLGRRPARAYRRARDRHGRSGRGGDRQHARRAHRRLPRRGEHAAHLACYVSWNRTEKTWDCPATAYASPAKAPSSKAPPSATSRAFDVERLQQE
jgi:hypothetical protein